MGRGVKKSENFVFVPKEWKLTSHTERPCKNFLGGCSVPYVSKGVVKGCGFPPPEHLSPSAGVHATLQIPFLDIRYCRTANLQTFAISLISPVAVPKIQ